MNYHLLDRTYSFGPVFASQIILSTLVLRISHRGVLAWIYEHLASKGILLTQVFALSRLESCRPSFPPV